MELVPRFGATKQSRSTMSDRKTRSRIAAREPVTAIRRASSRPQAQTEPPEISSRWLFSAILGTVAAAALCGWGVLCLLFWQGSWQLLYHPSASLAYTPARAGLAFDPVSFAVTDDGQPRLTGWWVPAPDSRLNDYTIMFLHGQNGNLGDTVETLGRLHRVGVNILAFDYRGYGQSQFVRPTETHWRQDADWALKYLTQTRHTPPNTIVLDGEGLGANLAIEVAAAHPELAGVILESPSPSPMDVIFSDPRARLVPARLLIRDRYDLNTAASRLRIPALWFEWNARDGTTGLNEEPAAFRRIADHKTLVWLNSQANANQDFSEAVGLWLDNLLVR